MKKSLLLLVLTLVLGRVSAQSHFQVFSVKEHKLITLDDIVLNSANADVLFFGEEHNDTIQHRIELTLLQKLSARYQNRLALSLEMFETDVQTVLNEYLTGQITEKFLLADARPWPNYKTDYRPLVELAKANHLPVIAANAPGRYVNLTNRKSLNALLQLSREAQKFLPPLPVDTAAGAYYEKFSQLMGGHGSMGGMQLYQAQNLWDATMGWSIAAFCQNHPHIKVMQVNGGFHSEDQLGTVAQLKRYAPGVHVLTISAYADEHIGQPDWAKYDGKADYLILTDFKEPNQ